jgi:hypothetical protein
MLFSRHYNPLVSYYLIIIHGNKEFAQYWHYRDKRRNEMFRWLEEECGVGYIRVEPSDRDKKHIGNVLYATLTNDQAMRFKLVWG